MPTVRPSQVRRSGKTPPSDKERTRSSKARDELVETYAGHENVGPAGKRKSQSHSTKVKDRKTSKKLNVEVIGLRVRKD